MTRNTPEAPLRREALARALDRCEHAARLWRRHPDAGAGPRPTPGATGSLSLLLWEELLALEQDCGITRPPPLVAHAAAYWNRRRALEQARREGVRPTLLPPPWRQVLQLPTPAVTALCCGLGVELLASAATVPPLRQLTRWLAPLGRAAEPVAARIAALLQPEPAPEPRVPASAAPSCVTAFEQLAAVHHGPRIVYLLGRRFLAACFQALDATARAEAQRVRRSALPDVLAADPPLVVTDASTGTALLQRALAAHQAAARATPASGPRWGDAHD